MGTLRRAAKSVRLLGACLATAAAAAHPAGAETEVRPPRLDEVAATLGPLLVKTSVDSTTQFTDNVFKLPRTVTEMVDADGDGTRETEQARRGRFASGVVSLRPQIELILPYSNSRLTAQVAPQFREYTRSDVPSQTAHAGGVKNELVFSNGMELDAEYRLTTGTAQTNDFDPAGQILFSTTPFDFERGGLDWSWDSPTRVGARLSAERETLDFSQNPRLLKSGGQVPYIDYERAGYSLDATWQAGPNTLLFGGAGRWRTRQDVSVFNDFYGIDEADTERLEEQALYIGADGTFGPRIQGEARVGVTRVGSSLARRRDFQGLSLNADLAFQLPGSSRLGLRLGRMPMQSLGGGGDIFVYDNVHVSWLLSPPRSGQTWAVAAQFQRAEYSLSRTGLLVNQTDDTMSYSGSWTLQMHRLARLRLTAFRADRRSTAGGAFEYAENRMEMSLILGWI